ncbi:iron ABC transporter permease [Candidatus Woesearchaeota archaeon]|nr:iron ABC transporter permease [Candidatus Woesearchaeota archaeon]
MKKKLISDYKKSIKKKLFFIMLTVVFLFVFIIIGVSLGAAKIPVSEVINVFLGNSTNNYAQIIFKIRIPRVLAAILAGSALAVSGAVMQSILRNPLGSPFTLGISHAAAFGAAFAVIILGAGSIQSSASDSVVLGNPYVVIISAFFFSIACVLLIISLSRLRGSTRESIILCGIVLGSLFSAGTTALEFFADDVQLSSIVFWTFGDLSRSVWTDFFILAAFIIPSILYFIMNSWNYKALDSGDETAKTLGVNVKKVRLLGLFIASLITAVVVSFFGIIAFVGLVVPHIIRNIVGNDERFLIPSSALFGGLFLLASDTIARTIISPVILPVGIMTSFFGAPLFLYLLIKKQKGAAC